MMSPLLSSPLLSVVTPLSTVTPVLAQADGGADPGVQGDGFMDIVLSGGIVGLTILLVLFALSVAAAYLVFDQIMTLRRSEILPDGTGDAVRQALLTGQPAVADAACRRQPSVLSVVLLSGLSELDFGWREVEKAVEDALVQQAARLMRRIEYLSVIGNIAPMVGLLGTVTGMIFAFQQVATTRGAAGAGDLAEGIYQALVTTVGGLVVAIPSLAVYAICRNRVDSLIAEVAYQAQHALGPIKRRPAGRPPSASAKTTAAKSGAAPAKVSPISGKTAPTGGKAVPPVPGSENAVPGSEKAVPGSGKAVPGSEKAVPGSGQPPRGTPPAQRPPNGDQDPPPRRSS